MLWHHNTRVNSHQRWKQTQFCVCFHLWCELTSTMRCNRMTSFMEFMIYAMLQHNVGYCQWKLQSQSRTWLYSRSLVKCHDMLYIMLKLIAVTLLSILYIYSDILRLFLFNGAILYRSGVKHVDSISLIVEITLIAGLWKCFLDTPLSVRNMFMLLFRAVRLVVWAVEDKTDLYLGLL